MRVKLVGGPADGRMGRVSCGHWWDYFFADSAINESYGYRLIWRYAVRGDMQHADFVEVINLGEYP